MSIPNIQPASGTQLLIIVGAILIMMGPYPFVGLTLLTLGVGAWAIYNALNIRRQV